MTTPPEQGAPLVSIITPSYNMASWLPRCLASVRAQTHPNIEHIVVDGVSSDDTVEILSRSDGVVWVSEPDRGQSDAINKGIRMASGDVLGWINVDDELTPGCVERVVAALTESPRAGLVYGDIEEVTGEHSRRVRPLGPFSVEGMWRGNVLSQPGTFWTRGAQALVGEIDESFYLAMDYDLWLRFAYAGVEALYVPEVQARFTVHDASKTSTSDWLTIAEEEARVLRKQGEHHGAAMAIDRWYWADVVGRVGTAAVEGRFSEASDTARSVRFRMTPILHRGRWFLRLAAFSPRAAGWFYKLQMKRTALRESL